MTRGFGMNISKILIKMLAVFVLSGCAITHQYGPYVGKVVDKETSEPLEGAVVFLQFFTTYPTPGGSPSWYADALEVITDDKGEFAISPHAVWVFRPFNSWDITPNVIVFKPGYGAFFRHKESRISKWKRYGEHNDGIPDDEPFTIMLPKLKTREERILNLGNIAFESDVPYEIWRNLFELRNIENIEIGLKPYKNPVSKGK